MALADPNTGQATPPLPAYQPITPDNLRVDPILGTSPLPVGTSSPSDIPPPVVTTMTAYGAVQGPIYDTTPWYVPVTQSSPAPAAPAPAAVQSFAPAFVPLAAPPAQQGTPFSVPDYPVQAPGAFVAPVGGFSARPAAGLGGGFLSVNVAGVPAWSSSGREQLAALPFAPHFGIRPGLGGIGRVLAGLGLAGPHRLPRWLEDAAGDRTPLTP